MNRSRTRATTRLAASLLAVAWSAAVASAQSLTTGELSGVVETPGGAPIADVQVALQPLGGGLTVAAETDRSGRFLFTLLPPGEYELLAERLGYQPVVAAPIPVREGRRLRIAVTLEGAAGPVEAPIRVPFTRASLLGGSRPGMSRHFGAFELRQQPARDGLADELYAFASEGERPLEAEGLPGSLGGFVVRGIPFQPVSHGAGAADLLPGLLLPMAALAGAELATGRPDVEWPGAAGALLSAMPRSAPSGLDGEVSASGFAGGMVLDDTREADPSLTRGGARVGGSLLGDSARGWVFAEAEQRADPIRFWPAGGDLLAAELSGEGLDVAALLGDRVSDARRVNLGGRFEWWLAEGRSLDVVALYGRAEQDYAVTGPAGAAVPAAVDGDDLLATAAAAGALGRALAGQLRVGFARSTRTYEDRRLAEAGLGDGVVVFPDPGARLGDPALPASLERSDIVVQGVLHYRAGAHQLKGGLGARLTRHDRTLGAGGEGVYLFGGAEDFALGRGVFYGLEGSAATADFDGQEYHAYGQDTWTVAPGLDLTTGLRYELESLPVDALRPNGRWLELTGIDNTAIDDYAGEVGLVVGFDWDVQEKGVWRVTGAFTAQQGDASPGLLAEAVTSGRGEVTAAVGAVDDRTSLGPRLTVLSPSFAPPRTTRGSIGVSRGIGSAALHLAGVVRRTDRLPSRSDLNLPVEPAFQDQYGRPVYGELVRTGPLLSARPGENRRFGEFDRVWGVASDATSRYWGVTGALEQRLGPLESYVSYTYSKTEDDWPGGGVAGPESAVPFAHGSEELDWRDGTSDFDVPHRFVAAAEVAVPFAPAVRVGAFWTRSSGRPFTPGFGAGIDANGDGVAGNDPAFVDDGVEGMQETLDAWPCLSPSTGGMIERNACRTPDRSRLDAWLGLRLPFAFGTPELRVEALALEASGYGPVDTALYRLDPAGELATDPATGTITVPLQVNPLFGTETGLTPELTRLRISFRMVF